MYGKGTEKSRFLFNSSKVLRQKVISEFLLFVNYVQNYEKIHGNRTMFTDSKKSNIYPKIIYHFRDIP